MGARPRTITTERFACDYQVSIAANDGDEQRGAEAFPVGTPLAHFEAYRRAVCLHPVVLIWVFNESRLALGHDRDESEDMYM